MMSRVRSRAYVASIVGYSINELKLIQHWIQSKCEDWVLLYTCKEGMPELKIYMKFSNAISYNSIVKLSSKLTVETSNISFRKIVDLYSQLGKIEYSPNMKFKNVLNSPIPVLQQSIMAVADNDSSIGKIHWFNYSITTTEHSLFMRYIASRDDILITSEDVDFIKNLLKEKICKQLKKIKSIILMPHKTKLSPSYYEIIDQLRNGFIHNNEYNDTPCVFSPINVIVYTNTFPDEEYKIAFNIQVKMV